MEFSFRRLYHGPIKLVIFDWIGTVIDYGGYAPVIATVETFKQEGIVITPNQVRALMETNQRERIKALSQSNTVATQWRKIHCQAITEHNINEFVDEMLAIFRPILLQHLADYTDLIPGAMNTINALLAHHIKIGATTEYSTEAMNLMKQEAAAQGYIPDSSVCVTQVPAGRPEPWMIFETMKNTGIYPPGAVVKVGDTLADVEAGLNAGVWTIYIAQTSSSVGLNQKEFERLDLETQQSIIDRTCQSMLQTGVHHVVDGIWDVPAVIEVINTRLADVGSAP